MEKSTARAASNKKQASTTQRYLSAISIVWALLLWLCTAPIAQAQAPDPHDVQFDHVFDLGALGSQACLQDHAGFLWIGSEGGGLFRWDGYTLYNYGVGPGRLSGGSIFRIVADVENPDILWIGTDGGLNRFDKATETFTAYDNDPDNPNSLSDDTVQDIVQDGRDTHILWLATTNGLNRFDKTTGTCTRYLHDPNNPNTVNFPDIWRLLEDAANPHILWIGTYGGGLDRFDKRSETFTHYTHHPENPNSLSDPDGLIDAIIQDRDNPQFLWIGSPSTGMSKFNTHTMAFTHYAADLTRGEVGLIYDDGQGRLWLGGYVTNNGLTIFDKATETFTNYTHDPQSPRSLINDLVVNVYQDRAGLFWIVTYAGKVDKIDPYSQNFQLYQYIPWNPNSLGDNAVTAFTEDRAGMIWIGTQAGLNRFDPQTGQITRYAIADDDPQNPHSNYILGMYEDSAGDFWVSLWAGAFIKLDRASGKIRNSYATETDGFAAIVEDPDDPNILWIGSLVAGLAKFDKQAETFTFYRQDTINPTLGPSTGYIYSVLHDREENIIWLGGWYGGGLSRFDKQSETFTHYVADPADPDSLSANVVTTVYQDRAGRVWVGTQGGGLNRFDKATETFTAYTSAQGIPANVSVILEDNTGRLWLGTNAGLLAFNPETETVEQHYDASDNLQGDVFLNGSGLKASDGALWLGGTNGANRFYPERLVRNTYAPPVILTSLTQHGQPVDWDQGKIPSRLEEITLNWNNNYFEFEFVVLNYTSPEKNQYAYMLEGVDQDWRYIGTRRYGNYTTLPAGTYTLRLKGANNHGVWNEAATTLKITVIPPFWQRGWFYAVAIAAAVLGIAGIFLGRLRAVEVRRRRLEVLVTARTQTLKETNFRLQREIVERQNAQEAAQRHAQTLAYLHQIVRQLTSTLELQQISAQLAQNGLNVLGTESLSVWFRGERDGAECLICWAAAKRDQTSLYKSPLHTSLPDAPNVIWDVIRKEQSIVTNDVPDEPYYHSGNAEQEAAPLQSLLIVPLRVRDTTLGALRMANKRGGAFTTNDLTLAETLAAAAAIAIDNARLVAELREYATDLESHVAELDAFALSVAHDLKNPLTILIGFSTILEEEWQEMTTQEVHTSLKSITRTGRKMGDIIDALLLLARLRRTERIEIRLLDMRAIVDSVQERLSKEIDRAGVQIDQPTVWSGAWGHPTLVEDIWFNYLTNALKYGAQSESAAPPVIQIGFDPPVEHEAFVRFWVRDNGIGLTPEARARLFTEFTRLEPTRSHGHGLGLSIVRRIAEKLGGKVGVDSSAGEGSTFWFTLPRRAGAGRPSISPLNPTPPAPD